MQRKLRGHETLSDKFLGDLSAGEGDGIEDLHVDRSNEAAAPAVFLAKNFCLEKSATWLLVRRVPGRLVVSKVELQALILSKCVSRLCCLFALNDSRFTVMYAPYVEDGLYRGVFEQVLCFTVKIHRLLPYLVCTADGS